MTCETKCPACVEMEMQKQTHRKMESVNSAWRTFELAPKCDSSVLLSKTDPIDIFTYILTNAKWNCWLNAWHQHLAVWKLLQYHRREREKCKNLILFITLHFNSLSDHMVHFGWHCSFVNLVLRLVSLPIVPLFFVFHLVRSASRFMCLRVLISTVIYLYFNWVTMQCMHGRQERFHLS